MSPQTTSDESDELDMLKRASVSFETETGNTASINSDVSDWLEYDISNYAQFHDRPGYRDGHIEVSFTVDKWGNKGHTVVDFTPEQLRVFLDELAETIGCDVVDQGEDDAWG